MPILASLDRSALFLTATLPKRVFPPRINRYGGGANHYGDHVDSAVRQMADRRERLRATPGDAAHGRHVEPVHDDPVALAAQVTLGPRQREGRPAPAAGRGDRRDGKHPRRPERSTPPAPCLPFTH